MDGIIVLNKEKNCTSRDVINKLNHILNTKKIGHTGTLDPIAEGVLVCAIGKYTKLVPLITSYDKVYIAEIKLGLKTDTLDITGNILEEKDVNIPKDTIINTFHNFPKSYMQTVPKYSAIKINGHKLYEYARSNIDIELPKRLVNIYSLELISFHNNIIKFKAHVSKGTYIRSLIQDICSNINTIGTMLSLTRIKQGNFNINNSYTINDIINNNYKLLKVEEFLDYPHLYLDAITLKKVRNGANIPNINNYKDKVLCFYNNKVIAIYIKENNYLKNYIQL